MTTGNNRKTVKQLLAGFIIKVKIITHLKKLKYYGEEERCV